MTSPANLLKLKLQPAPVQLELKAGGMELLADLAEPWNRLSREVKADPFLSPDWIGCYLSAFEPDAEVIVIAVLCGERMVAVLPLTRKRIWYRGIPLIELKGTANAHSVWFDILRTPGPDGDQAINCIWNYLRGLPNWHVLELPYVPEQGAARRLLQKAAAQGLETLIDPCAECPVMNLQVGADGHLDALGATSARFRHDLRRSARRLAEELGGEPQLRCWRKPGAEELQPFYELEAAGWKGSAGTAIQSAQDTRSYYRDIIQFAARNGYLLFHRFEVKGGVLAACIGVRAGSAYYGLKMAYDEGLRTYSPGHLMVRGIVEECAQACVARIVLGGKLDPYKKKWTSDTDPLVTALIYRPGLRSRIAFFERSRLFPAMRSLLERAQSTGRRASTAIANAAKSLKERMG
jgi:CelD/BcsL family acetyltransferase involved in cellulose biosynthesis